MNASLYDSDFYAWANEQASLLRAGKLASADIENIAEEIENIGKSEKRELVFRLAILLRHLLKWQYQSAGQCTSWRLNIEEQRREVFDVLADNPSLKHKLLEAIEAAYFRSVLSAAKDTSLPKQVFPAECPWSFDQIMRDDFWPE
jgi:hypothetical protein